ncbi:MAG: hypothetical protein E4H15_02130 [Syntrophobacterales bacterium]|nr:MAG: hypothetical protein E4H15_02130 [Syntrophobacterales bacterium]
MPEKILGLDIGEDSIKAVQVAVGFREYHLLNSALVNISEAGGIEAALDKLLGNDTFRSDVCVTSLPVWQVSFRNSTLPFKNRKKISQVLPYEIEPFIPYPLDDVLVDYTITVQSEHSEVLAASVLKSTVGDLVSLLAPYQVEISIIDIGAAPVALKLMALCDPEEYILLVDIGKRGTAGVFFKGNKIFQIRHFRFGGDEISAAMMKTFGCDEPSAEERKRRGDTGEAREGIRTICTAFFADVSNTLYSLALNNNLDPMPTRIFLTGGGALYPPIKEEMESFFSLPVAMADVSAADNLCLDQSPALMNQALALATREVKETDGFNFRLGEFRLKKRDAEFKKNVRWIAIFFSIILCVFGINSYLSYHYDKVLLDNLRQEVTAVFRDTLPEVTRIVDPVHQMRTEVEKLRNPSAGGENSIRGTRVLDILNDISRLLPQSVAFLITSFQYDGNTVTIKGQTDNFNTADNIKKALDKSDIFKDVKISSASLIKKESQVELNLRLDLQ